MMQATFATTAWGAQRPGLAPVCSSEGNRPASKHTCRYSQAPRALRCTSAAPKAVVRTCVCPWNRYLWSTTTRRVSVVRCVCAREWVSGIMDFHHTIYIRQGRACPRRESKTRPGQAYEMQRQRKRAGSHNPQHCSLGGFNTRTTAVLERSLWWLRTPDTVAPQSTRYRQDQAMHSIMLCTHTSH
jgi:hypothetical protein